MRLSWASPEMRYQHSLCHCKLLPGNAFTLAMTNLSRKIALKVVNVVGCVIVIIADILTCQRCSEIC